MSKFKVGDRVRVIDKVDRFYSHAGAAGTIRKVGVISSGWEVGVEFDENQDHGHDLLNILSFGSNKGLWGRESDFEIIDGKDNELAAVQELLYFIIDWQKKYRNVASSFLVEETSILKRKLGDFVVENIRCDKCGHKLNG